MHGVVRNLVTRISAAIHDFTNSETSQQQAAEMRIGVIGTGARILTVIKNLLGELLLGKRTPAAGFPKGVNSLVVANAIDEAMDNGVVVDLRPQ